MVAGSDVRPVTGAYHQAVSPAIDLRRVLTAPPTYLLDAAVALALTLASSVAVSGAAHRRGSTLVDGLAVETARLMARAVPLWWTFTGMLVVALLLHRRWPLPALVLAGLGGVGHGLDLYRADLFPQPVDLVVPIVLFTLAGGAASRRASLVAAATLLAVAYGTSVVESALHATPPPTDGGHSSRALAGAPAAAIPAVVAIVLAVALGDAVRSRRAQRRAVQERAADLQREQQQRAALATAAERAQITRELHDVIAHSLSVMVAQAQAATAAQDKYPERAATAMHEVVAVGRTSLAEMRHLLATFRTGPVGRDDLAPQPGLGALPELIDRVRAAGTPVRVDIQGRRPAALPATVELAAYRIVQEALTNTLKHAGPGARATVRLTFGAHDVDVEITDDGVGDGAGQDADRVTGHGNGLRGVTERVNLLGGDLTVGPTPPRGFAVRARLPVPPPEPGDRPR